jgi:hypothetical protein
MRKFRVLYKSSAVKAKEQIDENGEGRFG